MPRNLGYRDVWENCYFSTYGREAAMIYGEKIYCSCGKRRWVHNLKEVEDGQVCHDWYKCKRLNQALGTFPQGKRVK